MSSNWNHHAYNDSATSGDNELRLIPLWSIILAVLLFAGAQYLFHMPSPQGGPNAHHRPHEMLPFRIIMGYTWGALFASYALLLGYVSRDVKRRGMSPSLWMLVCLVLPGGVGAVVYFLLRQPILQHCPHCSTEMNASFNFCPQCQFQVAPVCGSCHRGVKVTDAFCVQCGHVLAEDNAPARLRVYGD
ncbi:zinc ribbon domain-containing protein [Granulicella cerasi]|uniref:Zinc ribbon domain-containing protein n=1 Tax=Granulicella cerasi TaxID=741063 RepID=A0ABW1ZB32_9BACT|nr:zinc ribbon domain-containing protein [Granulicella cerasi]